MALGTYHRENTDKTYLFELNIVFAAQIGCMYADQFFSDDEKPKKIAELIDETAHRTLAQLPHISQSDLIKKVIDHAKIIYPSLPVDKLPDQNGELNLPQISKWLDTIIRRGAMELLKASGCEVIPLSQKDIPPFIKLNAPLEKISCYEYALMRAGVEEAFTDHRWKEEDLLELLPKWGFTPISKEGSRPGDLVLYLKEGKPGHLGIRYKKEILSKPGNNQRFAHVHTIDETFTCWGDEVLFFTRKR